MDEPAPHNPPSTPQPASAVDEELGFALPPPAKLGWTRGVALALALGTLVGGAFLSGLLPRQRARAALLEEAAHAGGPRRVEVVSPTLGSASRSLTLPGTVLPLEETVVYPRANGYLRRWLVDLGQQVTEGQLLAEIETPELDQELAQARAQLAQAQAVVAQAEANRSFARSDAARYQEMARTGLASQQDFEQRRANLGVGDANVLAARAAVGVQQANVQRLTQLRSFARVTAPFAGIITARTVERGALLTAGTATPLFRVAVRDPVRVLLQVPQDVAPGVREGLPGRVTVREFPGRNFAGQVSHFAGSLDAVARTMNTELLVPNADAALMPGMFAEVALTLGLPHRVYEVPATALFTDGAGVRVAVLTADNRVHLAPVTIERDTGSVVQLSAGLTGSERVVRLASVELTEGLAVEPVLRPAAPAPR